MVTTDGLQMHRKSRVFYMRPGRETSLLHPQSSSCGKSNWSPHYKIGWITARVLVSALERVSRQLKYRHWLAKKQTQNPITWVGDMWENPIEAENFDSSDYHLGITQAHIFSYSKTCYLWVGPGTEEGSSTGLGCCVGSLSLGPCSRSPNSTWSVSTR